MLQQWRRITVLEKAGQVNFKPCLEGHRQLLKKMGTGQGICSEQKKLDFFKLYVMYSAGACTGQKRTLDPLQLQCEPPNMGAGK